MIDPSQAKQLADAGGWAAFLVLCAALGIGFVRGWVVPGWIYQAAVKRAETLVEQLERNTEALKAQTQAFDATLTKITEAVSRLRAELLRRDRAGRPDAGP